MTRARPSPARLLRALVLAAAALVFCWPLTTTAGLVAAGLGAGLGALVGAGLARTRVRALALLALAAIAGLLGSWIARWLVTTSAFAAALGPLEALALSEALFWLCAAGATATALRFLAARSGAMAVLEVVAVGGALAWSLAAHRDGSVHRPMEIADWAFSRGGDPVVVFLAIGGLGSLLLASLLISEDRRRRLPLHFAGLLVLALLLLSVVRLTGPPEPRAAGDLGLTGDPKKEDRGEGPGGEPQEPGEGGQGRGTEHPAASGEGGSGEDGLPFRNEYSSRGGEAPVGVVLLHEDYSPPSGIYYFRQSAFSEFNGIRLVEATRDDVDRDLLPRFPSRRETVPEVPPPSTHRLEVRTTVGLLAEHVKPFALDSPVVFAPVQNPDPLRFRRAYGAESLAQTIPYEQLLRRRPGRTNWTEEQWRHYTDHPRRDPRYAQLAGTIVEGLKEDYRSDPLAQALAVKTWLDQNGIYSRRSQHADKDDPTASFLFGDLTGYCVHFAHAAAFLLRSRGVPARVAGGYAVEESRRAGGSALMIRGQDAHAWPEIYLDGIGWVVVDLTPERTLDPPSADADPKLQQMLGQMLRKSPKSPEEAEGKERPWPSLEQIARVAASALLALLLAVYAVKQYRALAPSLASSRQLYRVGYRAALDRLSDVGIRRGFGETREGFARRARSLSPSFEALTWRHLATALGSTARPGAEEIRRLARQVGREVRERTPAWRWVLGTLDPTACFRSR